MGMTSLPRVRLGTFPTPLQYAPHLTETLGGPRIYIKRDDLTGLAFGGNKTRMLEYLIGDALHQDATHLITEGGPQSNHVRQTLGAARIFELEVIIVQNPVDSSPEVQGNFLLDRILGIDYEQVDTEPERRQRMAEIADRLRAEGHRPYIIPGGGSNEVGAPGYVGAMLELNRQLWDQGIDARALYFPSGGGGTQAGIALGAALYGASFRPIGVMIEDDAEVGVERAWRIIERTVARLGIDSPMTRDDLICMDGHVGPGYAIPTTECIDAIRLLAHTEAIFLEPIYTAKAFAGMVTDIGSGRYGPEDEIVFLHTGGQPVLFALVDQLEAIL